MLNIALLLFLFIGVGLPIYLFLSNGKSNWQKFLGDSFFLGIFFVIIVLNIVQLVNIDLNISMTFRIFLIYSFSLFLIVILINRKRVSIPSLNNFHIQYKNNVYYFLAFVIIAIHLYHIILQNTSMPLIGWDAWNGWVAKAKIWYFHGINEPLIDRLVWLQSDSVLTNPIVHYPDGLSLLYLFESGYWGWNETELNAIYPAMFIALIFSFYGNIKILTQSRVYSWIAVSMLVTIPILNIHLVIAGYADIWIAAFLILSVFYAQLFLNKPNIKSFLSMLIFSMTMVMFKLESWVWLAIFVSAFILSVLSTKKRYILYVLFVSVCFIWWANDGLSISLPIGELIIKPNLIQIPLLGSYTLTFLNTSAALLEALFFSQSWGLLWYLIPIILILPFRIKDRSTLVLPSLFLIFTLFFLFVLFFMSYASNFANDFTSSNRIVMHIVPLYIYLFIQIVNQYQYQKKQILIDK